MTGGSKLLVVVLSSSPHTTLNLSREIWRNCEARGRTGVERRGGGGEEPCKSTFPLKAYSTQEALRPISGRHVGTVNTLYFTHNVLLLSQGAYAQTARLHEIPRILQRQDGDGGHTWTAHQPTSSFFSLHFHYIELWNLQSKGPTKSWVEDGWRKP